MKRPKMESYSNARSKVELFPYVHIRVLCVFSKFGFYFIFYQGASPVNYMTYFPFFILFYIVGVIISVAVSVVQSSFCSHPLAHVLKEEGIIRMLCG